MTRKTVVAVAGLLLSSLAFVGGCTSEQRRADANAERTAREAFTRAVAVDAGAGRILNIASRGDVLFEEGFSLVSYDPAEDFRGTAFRWMGQRGHVRVYNHGHHAMNLKLVGWVNEKVIRAKPVVTVYFDGQRIGDTGAIEAGSWGVETTVPAAMLEDEGWRDLVITVSAVGYHWADPPDLRVVVLNSLEWWETP